jgi:hypothetical protein
VWELCTATEDDYKESGGKMKQGNINNIF